MAEPAKKKQRARKPLSEEQKKRKRQEDRARSQTRINIGPAFSEWRELKDNLDCKSDGDLAFMLLHFYKCRQVTSTPSKGHPRPPRLPESSITGESERDLGVAFPELGVQPLIEEGEVGALESSMHSLDIGEAECDSPDEGGGHNLRNTVIDIDDFWVDNSHLDLEGGDTSDEDFVPSPYLRTVVGNATDLEEITMDESVLDFEMPAPPDEEPANISEQQRVVCEDDLIGKQANITFNDQLHALAMHLSLPTQICNHTDKQSGPCPGAQPFRVILKTRGTGVILEWLCPFGHTVWRWNSQPTLKFGMQSGDFLLSMNILLSGNNYRKVAMLFKCMNMGMVAEGTFFRIQDSYCIEPVQEYWEATRAEVLERLRQKDHVVVLGDGRMDSPGHCAQFCTYTTIEQESRDIVYIVSVDKRETARNSVIMERECFVKTMDALLPDIQIKEVVTDAHPQITALLNPERGKYKAWGIHHSLDIWHAAKSLSKKLRRAGSIKNQNGIQVWIRDIVNHFWYCAKQAATEEQFKMMWVGVLHHVRNEHSWATGYCDHAPLEEGSEDKPWIIQGSAAHQALTTIVLDKRWLTQVKKFINFRTTSDLESFQNHIIMYAAKRMSYTSFVYKTRTLLAAIDYNKHNQRLPARNREGHKMYRRSYNKKSKTWGVYTIKEKKLYSYIPDIQRAILARRLRSGTGLPRNISLRPEDPRRLGLLAPEQPPPTSELVRTHVARGNIVSENPQD